ncbi:hypothetical protein F4808DRAFT_272449 [Astrocystis sublimbata]|nr:hypothetical protein F4808DRAFT_272449 [Astrocystis sublimbata]
MDGDLGYHLMSTNAPREVLAHRNQQPSHRPQNKANPRSWRISTWSSGAGSAGAGAGAGAGADSGVESPATGTGETGQTGTGTRTRTGTGSSGTGTGTGARTTTTSTTTSTESTPTEPTSLPPPITAAAAATTGTTTTTTTTASNSSSNPEPAYDDDLTTSTSIISTTTTDPDTDPDTTSARANTSTDRSASTDTSTNLSDPDAAPSRDIHVNSNNNNKNNNPTPATASTAECPRETLTHRGRHDGPLDPRECTSPTPSSPEQSTAAGRLSFGLGDYRSRIFGRAARRRTSSLTRLPTLSSSHARTSSTYASSDRSHPRPSSSDQGQPAPPFRSSTTAVPSVASPSTSLTRLYKRDPFYRRSTHQTLSPSIKTSTNPSQGSTGAYGSRGGKTSSPTSYQSLNSLSNMPSPRNSSVTNHSGISASNETLLSTSAERSGSGPVSTASYATSTTSKPNATQLRDARAFVVRNGRTYINDPTLPYPLPVDLPELHRQSLRTLLMFQLFGGPILSSAFSSRPPTRVLDVGCGAGFWSMMCHRYFAQHGHASISFTGLDIVPLGGSGGGSSSSGGGSSATATKPDKEMRWQFVQHDIRQLPWPFADGEFDLVMVKDMSFAASAREAQNIIDEYLRVLKPGGVLEYWETDSNIRMLRPHAVKNAGAAADFHDDDTSSEGGDDEDNAERMGAYVMTNNTPISQPLNPYLVEYNGWSTKALEARGLSAAPCTSIGPSLLQEAESLTDVHSKRLAVPLSEIRWEREGVGGVVTKDGKSYIDTQKGKFRDQDWKSASTVTAAQSALRRTALETTVSFILALEPLLREVSNKSQEEWDTWAGKMTNDLLREGGTSWGECLEVGAWTSRKRHSKS